ncbi:Spc98 family-domain-containing protein [Thamnidium elegans]|nr:Spc98 family-domain-containing protein [Thamnidium elegans]
MVMTKDQLTGRLVNKLTGLEINTPEWNKAVQKVKYMLIYEKCTSTSEYEVETAINGLAEKFSIKGHGKLSKALIGHKTEFLKTSRPIGSPHSNQSILKYDMLQLLLSLSSSENQVYNYASKTSSIEKEQSLTWEDVVKDDPLQGDHWKTWPEDVSNDDFSDDDGYELEEENTPFRQSQPQYSREITSEPETRTASYIDQMDIDERADSEALDYLATQQYWRPNFKLEPEDTTNIDLLKKPCQLNEYLNQIYYSEVGRRQFKSVPEAGVVREVISLLKGCRGVLFHYVDDHFQLDENYVIQHLSQKALGSLLAEFCIYGNILSELRQIVTRVANDIKYGQTSQAFAACIFKSLQDFDVLLSEQEMNTSFITHDKSQSISLLKLRHTLDAPLHHFKEIHDITMNIPFAEVNPRLIATYLISVFYDRATAAQYSEQIAMHDTLLYVLEQLLVPYGRMIDDWIFYGSLEGDITNEFFVARKENVSTDQPNFWIDGFSIQPFSQDYVSYQCPLFNPTAVSRIFFTGKAVNLLLQIEKKLKNVKLLSQPPIPFLEIMSNFLTMKSPFIIYNKIDPVNHNISSFNSILFPTDQCQSESVEIYQPIIDDVGSLFDQNFKQFIEKYIQEPYRNTADTLNNVLHKDSRLPEQLKSLASIYLMLENDLMHSFCQVLFKQMDDNEPWFDKRMLNSTFSEACKLSGYDEIVYIQLGQREESNRQRTSASYLDLIEFKVEIPWPLNNFIQSHHLDNYNKISGFLLRLKRAKYVMENKTLFRNRLDYRKSDDIDMRYYSIRMRLLWFINSFWRYIMTTILHAETLKFKKKLSVSKNADEITELHASYIHRIIDRCLLNDKSISIKKSIISIFDMAEKMVTMFIHYMEVFEGKDRNVEEFTTLMDTIEKDFTRTNEFISVSLMILGKKANLPWFESLATSLSTR